MAWRPSGRDSPWGGPETKCRVARDRRRPSVECLETRQLLSGTSSTVSNLKPRPMDGSTNFDQIIGASATRSQFNVDGTGQSVAVIDTGVNYNDIAARRRASAPATRSSRGSTSPGAPMACCRPGNTGRAWLRTDRRQFIDYTRASHPGPTSSPFGSSAITTKVASIEIARSAGLGHPESRPVQHHGREPLRDRWRQLHLERLFANDGGVGQQITQAIGTARLS